MLRIILKLQAAEHLIIPRMYAELIEMMATVVGFRWNLELKIKFRQAILEGRNTELFLLDFRSNRTQHYLRCNYKKKLLWPLWEG